MDQLKQPIRRFGAELIVVVVGILIALGIDQTIQSRRERALERNYLLSLLEDFNGVADWLDDFGSELNSRKQSEILALTKILETGSVTPIDTIALAYSLTLLSFNPVFPVPRATYDDLTGTGNLRVVRNRQLRSLLVDFFLWQDTFSTHELAMIERTGQFKQIVGRHVPPSLVAAIADVGWSTLPEPWAPFQALTIPAELRANAARVIDVDRIRRDPSLLAGLSVLMDDLFLQRRSYEVVGGRARAVLEALQDELGTPANAVGTR